MFRQVFFKAKYAYFFTWEIQHCFFHTLSWGNRKNKVSEINTSPLAQQPHSSLHSYFSSHLHFVEWNKSSCTSSLVEGKKVISHFTVTRGFKKCFFFNFFPHFSPSFSWDLDIVCPHKTFSVRTNVITIGFARLYFDLLYFLVLCLTFFFDFSFQFPRLRCHLSKEVRWNCHAIWQHQFMVTKWGWCCGSRTIPTFPSTRKHLSWLSNMTKIAQE